MNETNQTPARDGARLEIRPSMTRGLAVVLGSVLLTVGFVRIGMTGTGPAYPAFLAAVLVGAGAVLAAVALLPGASGLWLDADGFELREIYSVKRYRWSEVGEFAVRRKILGRAVEFAYQPSGGKPEKRSLSASYTIPAFRLAQLMNEWRERALARRR
jgi:hypothetical protein